MTNFDFVFCIPGKNFSSKFLHSWTNSIIYLMQQQITWTYTNRYTPIVASTRNEMMRLFPGQLSENSSSIVPFDNKIKCKKVIFIDDDMVWEVDDLVKIMQSDKDIVSGFCKMESLNENGENKLSGVKDGKWLTEKDIENERDLIELDGAGFAFMSIDFDIFNKIKFPWFETFDFFSEKDNAVYNISEDVLFCKKAKELGYKIYGDPTVKIGHEKLKVLEFKK